MTNIIPRHVNSLRAAHRDSLRPTAQRILEVLLEEPVPDVQQDSGQSGESTGVLEDLRRRISRFLDRDGDAAGAKEWPGSTMAAAALMGDMVGALVAPFASSRDVSNARDEIIRSLAAMVGFQPGAARGCFVGRRAGRFDALENAYSLRLRPYQVRLALEDESAGAETREMLAKLELGGRRLAELRDRDVRAIPLGSLAAFAADLNLLLSEQPEVQHLLQHWSPEHLGLARFGRYCGDLLFEDVLSRFVILVPAGLRGAVLESTRLPGAAIVPVSISSTLALDLDELERIAGSADRTAAAVVGRLGSPEGAVDDIGAIGGLRTRLRDSGSSDYWIHVDGAWGGYWLSGLSPGEDFGTEMDSIFVDPCAAGYTSAPAGLTLYREGALVAPVVSHAPVVDIAQSDSLGESGILSLWSAHQCMPPGKTGYGRAIGAASAGADLLRRILQEGRRSDSGDAYPCARFLSNDPSLGTLSYSFPMMGDHRITLATLNRALELLSNTSAIDELDTPTASTALSILTVEQFGSGLTEIQRSLAIPGRLFFSDVLAEAGNPWRDDSKVLLLCTTVSPSVGEDGDMASGLSASATIALERYAERLQREVARSLKEILSGPIPREYRPVLPGKVLVLEDDEGAREALIGQFRDLSFDGAGRVFGAGSLAEGLRVVEAEGIQAALVDIDLGGGFERGGIDFLRALHEDRGFRGAVVFTSHRQYREEIMSLAGSMSRRFTITYHEKPAGDADDPFFQEAANKLAEDFWDILGPVLSS